LKCASRGVLICAWLQVLLEGTEPGRDVAHHHEQDCSGHRRWINIQDRMRGSRYCNKEGPGAQLQPVRKLVGTQPLLSTRAQLHVNGVYHIMQCSSEHRVMTWSFIAAYAHLTSVCPSRGKLQSASCSSPANYLLACAAHAYSDKLPARTVRMIPIGLCNKSPLAIAGTPWAGKQRWTSFGKLYTAA
jgi:hypothetical protein